MDTDRDVLFTALAVQQGDLDAERLAESYKAWRKSTLPLSDVIVKSGWIKPERCDQLQESADELLRSHDGDPYVVWAEAVDGTVREALSSLGIEPFQPTLDISPEKTHEADTVDSGFQQNAHNAERPRFVGIQSLVTDESSSSLQGSTTTRYSRTKLHAQGGIGQIWQARDLALGREVAMKELKTDRTIDPLVAERFAREARITGRLEHPNIVPVHELGRHPEDGHLFYTMRFVRGKTLAEAIDKYHQLDRRDPRRSLELRGLLEAFIAVCNAIAFAHSRGVIHRDLKGQNVIVGDFGEVQVLDWGLAKAVGSREPEPSAGQFKSPTDSDQFTMEGQYQTLEGHVVGTPSFMSPEQARGEIDQLGPATDVYSLGAVLYQILTGRPPHHGSNASEVLQKVRNEEAPPCRSIDPSIPKPLEAICQFALGRSKEARYPTVKALSEDVHRWLADEPVSVYPEPFFARVRRWAIRHRTLAVSASVLILATIPLLATANFLIGRSRDRATQMEGVARTAVEEMYVEVASTFLEDLSDPRQDLFLSRALDQFNGTLAGPEESGPGETAPKPPDFDARSRDILATTLSYFVRFANEPGVGSEVLLDQADALRRSGDIHRKLGRFEEAERSYQDAIEKLTPIVQKQPDSARAKILLATAQYRLGALLGILGETDRAESLLLEAIVGLEGVDPAALEDPEDRLLLARAEGELAEVLKLDGRSIEAKRRYQSAIDRLEALVEATPDSVPARRELSSRRDHLAVLELILGQSGEAERLLELAIEEQRELLNELPTVPTIREGLAKSSNTLGAILYGTSRPEEAEQAYAESLKQYERLAGDFPGRLAYQRALGRSYLNRGVLLQELGDLPTAEESLREAVSVYDALAATAPGVLKIGRDRVLAMVNLARVLVAQSQYQAAYDLSKRAVVVGEGVQKQFAEIPDVDDVLGVALINRSRLLLRFGAADRAETDLQRGSEIYDRLIAADPDRPSYRQKRADCLELLALAQKRMDQIEVAEKSYDQVIEMLEALIADSAEPDPLKRQLATSLVNLGDMRKTDPEPTREALELYEELVDGRESVPPSLSQELGIAQYNLGEQLARIDQTEEAESYFAQAAEQLGTLADSETGTANIRYMASVAAFDYARLLIDRGAAEQAQGLIEQAIQFAQQSIDALSLAQARQTIDQAITKLVEALIAQRLYDEAGDTAVRLANAIAGQPALRQRTVELLADCLEAIENDPELTPERVAALRDRIKVRAIAHLQVALDEGLDRRLLQDRSESFGSFADDQEFRALLDPTESNLTDTDSE